MQEYIVGILGSSLIAGAAYWKRSLSGSGFLAAIIVGTLLYAWGSAAWFGTLIAFFISSTLLTKWKQKSKAAVESGYEKTGRRDAGQVLANGGLAVIFCGLNLIWPDPVWGLAFLGVMATVNADTWATEIGSVSGSVPRSILSWKRVPTGTSGGITMAGIAASLAGGIFIGGVVWLFQSLAETAGSLPVADVSGISLLVIGAVAGLAGSLTDSLLGASVQIMYRCEVCGKEIERTSHCQTPASKLQGKRFLSNDNVNVLSSVVGGLAAIILGTIM